MATASDDDLDKRYVYQIMMIVKSYGLATMRDLLQISNSIQRGETPHPEVDSSSKELKVIRNRVILKIKPIQLKRQKIMK